MERVALKNMPFPDDSSGSDDMSSELQKMKTWHPDDKADAPSEGKPAAQQKAPQDEPAVVSAEQVAHMKPWSPADLRKQPAAKDDLTPPAPGEDQPKVLSQADLPHKTPWSTLASEQADKLAQEAELAAAQAEIDARNKQSLFEKEDTAADKVAADTASKQAKELELRAKVAEEIAAEQAQWATEQGELRTANRILSTDPELWQVDENTTLPKT